MSLEQISITYEVYPPKTTASAIKLGNELHNLARHKPRFISVTCGAGGSQNSNNLEVCDFIQNTLHTKCVAHVTCIGMNQQQAERKIQAYIKIHVDSLLVLRGDNPDNLPLDNSLPFASSLAQFVIHTFPEIDIFVAGYPEGHIQNSSKESDLRLQFDKAKIGAQGIISQLFFNNQHFFDYREKAHNAGYTGDLLAGIFPVTSGPQLEKISQMCRVDIPEKLGAAVARYRNDPLAMQAFGVDYASEQMSQLIDAGHKHFHLYCMNKCQHINKIRSNLQLEARQHRLTGTTETSTAQCLI